jgi:transcriptional regulator with XRE-family HTH domain
MDGGNAWSAYLRRMLTATGLSVAELAKRAQLDRSTVSTWANRGEAGKRITVDSVLRVAAALGDDPATALSAAAGLTNAAPERDPEVEMILASDWTEERKTEVIERLMRRREEQRQERLANLRFLLGDTAD